MPLACDVNRPAAFCVSHSPDRRPTSRRLAMLDRRSFLAHAGGTAAALLAVPGLRAEEGATAPAPLPPRDLYLRDEEAYWTEIRKQFLIPPDEVYLNNGTVGSCPWPVLRAV